MRPAIYTFVCPECHKTLRLDQPGEPLCTGPNEATDDHLPVIMHLKSKARAVNPSTHFADVHPERAAARALGPLIIPNTLTDPVVYRKVLSGMDPFEALEIVKG